MKRTGRLLCILIASGLALAARPVLGEKLKLKLKWSQEFAKPVDWYVRTSAGIIVAKAGKSVVGIDELEGSLLWTLSDVDVAKPGKWIGSQYSSEGRAHDVMEIIPVRAESWPHLIVQTSSETVVTIAALELCGYNFKTGNCLPKEN